MIGYRPCGFPQSAIALVEYLRCAVQACGDQTSVIEGKDTALQIAADGVEPSVILGMGRRAIATEAEALWTLGQGLDETFVDAARCLRNTRGRIIVCGLGKSGHIAHKIAATLMATGTPACFLHAGDAVHGDLGLMMSGDTLMILSNSGDTREFGVIVRRSQKLSVPIVAITSGADSVVATSATICLVLPSKPEACPYGSSPTTSTTMMLALGDALAITVMRLRGIGAPDLLALHPGGRLGLDLVMVDSFMHRDALPLVSDRTPMRDVLESISASGFGVAGVIDKHRRLLGVITDGDIRRKVADLPHADAGEVMTSRPRTLTAGAMARDALVIMSEARITSLFVIDTEMDGRVVGLIHLHDLLRLGVG